VYHDLVYQETEIEGNLVDEALNANSMLVYVCNWLQGDLQSLEWAAKVHKGAEESWMLVAVMARKYMH
jgi:hypothetical protein